MDKAFDIKGKTSELPKLQAFAKETSLIMSPTVLTNGLAMAFPYARLLADIFQYIK